MPSVYTYHRCATDDPTQARQHSDALNAWLSAHPEYTVRGAYADHGVSGRSAARARPGLSALLDALTREPADQVLIPAVHHLARDPALLHQLRGALHQRGAALLTTTLD